jgi:hypothetical protein
MIIWFALVAMAAETSFPERMPSMMESCINQAVTSGEVSENRKDHKYICSGQFAQDIWDYLENAKIESWKQTTENGIWLSRDFPMGGCFKKIRNSDNSTASNGLSCSIWIPRLVQKKR